MFNSIGYLVYFYYYALRGIFRKQNINLPSQPISVQKKFLLTKNVSHQWEKLFDAESYTQKIPFTYYWIEFEKFYLRLMDSLRFNYRNILHLGHEISFSRDSSGLRVNELIQLKIGIKDIALLDRDRAVILIEAQIEDEKQNEICKTVDTIFLKGLNEKNIKNVVSSTHFNQTDTTSFRNLAKREPQLQDNIQKSSFIIPEKFGSQYGKVSGDRNPVHTGEWLAKFFGYPKSFIQGSATINFLFKYFMGEQGEKIKKFSIKFCKPIFHGELVQIHSDAKNFELIDRSNKLLVFGTRE